MRFPLSLQVDTFWCYVGLMERLSTNFAKDQAGMHLQLAALRQLVQVLDPQLHAFLEARDCLNYFFAFRWLLIHFKREFAFEQVSGWTTGCSRREALCTSIFHCIYTCVSYNQQSIMYVYVSLTSCHNTMVDRIWLHDTSKLHSKGC